MAAEQAEPTGSALADNPLLRPRYTRWVVFVLLLVAIMNFADRAILAVLAQPIKEDLQLTDTDLGVLQGLGFAILYSVLGIPLGLMAERTIRTRMLAICIAAWSFMTMACGLANSFATMLLGRIGVGIGEAGAQPISSSLIADHVPPARRGSMLAIILLGAPFGFLLGQSIGGIVADEWGWRAAFFVMGIPGLLVALLVLFTLREPPRGLAEGAAQAGAASPPSFVQVVRYIWGKRTFRHLLAGFVLGGFALNAIANFALPFYLRGFGLPLATMGALFGAMSFLSNGIGMLLGGFGFDRLAKHDRRWSMWGPGIALLACIPFYAGAFVSTSIWASLGFMFLGNMALASHMAPTSATMQNMVGPRMRATTSAIVALVVGILGAGLGPTVAGMLSDRFAADTFAGGDFFVRCPGGRGGDGIGTALDIACLSASTDGLRLALISVLVVFLWAAVHYVLAGRHLARDLYDPASDAAATRPAEGGPAGA